MTCCTNLVATYKDVEVLTLEESKVGCYRLHIKGIYKHLTVEECIVTVTLENGSC